jgi:hypothetical protein
MPTESKTLTEQRVRKERALASKETAGDVPDWGADPHSNRTPGRHSRQIRGLRAYTSR